MIFANKKTFNLVIPEATYAEEHPKNLKNKISLVTVLKAI